MTSRAERPCAMCGYVAGGEDAPPIETAVYDLKTLERVHEVWEFLKTEQSFDTWLHAQILRAREPLAPGKR